MGRKKGNPKLEEKIIKAIKKSPMTYREIQGTFGIGRTSAQKYIRRIENKFDVGYMDDNVNQRPIRFYIKQGDILRRNEFDLNADDGKYKMAITSDYHINDKQFDKKALDDAFTKIQEADVDIHIMAGDLDCGQGVYKGQNNDLTCWGFDEHKDGILNNVPELDGIPTYFIAGNHDASFLKKGGADICKSYAKEVDEWNYCGVGDSRILLTDWEAIDIHHKTTGQGGSAYAISYPLQKRLRTGNFFDAPTMFVQGHYHRLNYYEVSGIKAFDAGTFQKINSYAKNMGFGDSVGFLFVDFKIKDERIDTNSMNVKFETYRRPARRIAFDRSEAEYLLNLKPKVRKVV